MLRRFIGLFKRGNEDQGSPPTLQEQQRAESAVTEEDEFTEKDEEVELSLCAEQMEKLTDPEA